VPLNRLIPERHRGLVKELLTFGTVGAINTALGQVLFIVFFGLGWLASSVISTAIATVCSFTLNRHVTYRHRLRTSLRRELPLFIGLNLVGLGIQVGILDGARRIFDIASSDKVEFSIARFGGVIVGTIFLLLTYRTFVFKAKKPEIAAVVEVPVQAHRTMSDAVEFAELTEQLEAEFDAAGDSAASDSAASHGAESEGAADEGAAADATRLAAPARPAPPTAAQRAITGAV